MRCKLRDLVILLNHTRIVPLLHIRIQYNCVHSKEYSRFLWLCGNFWILLLNLIKTTHILHLLLMTKWSEIHLHHTLKFQIDSFSANSSLTSSLSPFFQNIHDLSMNIRELCVEGCVCTTCIIQMYKHPEDYTGSWT